MSEVRPAVEWMKDRGLRAEDLVESSGLDRKVVEAIVEGRYTPSLQQRRRLAAALGVAPELVAWGHVTGVDHMYGHGPQFGRSP